VSARLNRNDMERLRDAKRSRNFHRLRSSQTVQHEFRSQFGHPSSCAFVRFECAPADDLSFESRAFWPSTVSEGDRTQVELGIAEAVADVLLEGVNEHSGCAHHLKNDLTMIAFVVTDRSHFWTIGWHVSQSCCASTLDRQRGYDCGRDTIRASHDSWF